MFFEGVPIEAQLIVTRRCNLSCGYCTEYDNTSKPVPLHLLKERIDALHRLGVLQISLLGGEPLLHDQIDGIVAYAARKSQVSITTNGFLVSEKIVHRLNDAGLNHLQVSVDALEPSPDMYVQKSMRSVRKKLERLKRLARFSVHANIVLCEESLADFPEMIATLRELDIGVTVNLLHDSTGKVEIQGDEFLEMWEHHHEHSKVMVSLEYEYGKRLLQGRFDDWHCRAGGRHLYVDEFGNAQYCAAQRGRLDRPITELTSGDLKRYGGERKGCEDGCAVFCVYRCSLVDNDPLGLIRSAVKHLKRGTWSLGFFKRGGVKEPSRETVEAQSA